MCEEGICTSPDVVAGSIFFSTYAIYIAYILAVPTIVWLISYSIPQIYMAIRPVPNLKKRYDATWSLVTGSGSGIGKALAFKLASQGLNVVLVSLDDDCLKQTMKEIKDHYPELEFRSVGVTFSPGVPYIEKLRKQRKTLILISSLTMQDLSHWDSWIKHHLENSLLMLNVMPHPMLVSLIISFKKWYRRK
mmetsp:Transcript_9554/g.11126  ORF Transcript_9554/g.11126 Transcript_9554/m.11126 type:complete len:191 (-) Transcript_9554:543-1115(-)